MTESTREELPPPIPIPIPPVALPPSSPKVIQDDSARLYVYLIFLTLTAIILPTWWYTTSVPRAALDFPKWTPSPQRILRRSRATIFLVDIKLPEWTEVDDQDLSPTNHDANIDINIDDIISVSFKELSGLTELEKATDMTLVVNTLTEGLGPSGPGEYQLFIIEGALPAVGGSSFNHPLRQPTIWIHPNRRVLICSNSIQSKKFSQPQAFLEDLFGELFSGMLSGEGDEGLIPDSPTYQITLTLLVGQSSTSPPRKLDWAIKEASRRYFLPLVAELQNVADMSLHYQVKSHVELRVELEKSNAAGFILDKGQIPVFVDENHWNIAASTLSSTPINFLLYIPPKELQPIIIDDSLSPKDGGGTFFGYQQWGGVYILNYAGLKEYLSVEQLQPVMATFSGQLKRLFGATLFRDSARKEFRWVEGGGGEEPHSSSINGISPVEVDGLLVRLLHLRLASTIKTLKALELLLNQYEEIPVLPMVGTLVRRASQTMRKAERYLSEAHWSDALIAATQAAQWSDSAFFHPTMMAHQYFPQEHKLGVYMPLFFPFILPLVVATFTGVIQGFQSIIKGKTKRPE